MQFVDNKKTKMVKGRTMAMAMKDDGPGSLEKRGISHFDKA